MPFFLHVTLLGPPHLAKAAAVELETLKYKFVDTSGSTRMIFPVVELVEFV